MTTCRHRFEAQHAFHTLRRANVQNCSYLMEGVDGTIGLLTTNSSKEVMCVAVQDLLAQDRLHVSTDMLSISQKPRDIYEQLISELRAFMIYVDPPKTLFSKVVLGQPGPSWAPPHLQNRAWPVTCSLSFAAASHVHRKDGWTPRRRSDGGAAGCAYDADLQTKSQIHTVSRGMKMSPTTPLHPQG